MNETQNDTIKLYIESPDGEQFECEVPADTQIDRLATDFFESRDWPTRDSRGRGQRAVVELVDPENSDRTKRLGGDQSVADAGLWDGAVLRVFPESIAGQGRVDQRTRVRALVADHRDMEELAAWDPLIAFKANLDHAPFDYHVTFSHESFVGLDRDGETPLLGSEHEVRITLGTQYPRQAPRVQWLTPIFHPNIDPESGAVCLGVLQDRYRPGIGLRRLVTMLSEMVQWRNFDMSSPLNRAAAEWAADPEHWPYIREIGGSPFQGPVYELKARLEEAGLGGGARPSITFRRVA